MKKAIVITLAMALALVLSLVAIPAQAATEDEIQNAIEKGKAWLVSQQNPDDGSWGAYDQVAHTGLAVVKLEEQAWELGLDPIDPAYKYSKNVVAGLNYIFGQAAAPVCDDDTVCDGIVFAQGWHETYSTGIAMMAIAASKAPDRKVDVAGSFVDGWTYKEVVQANVDYFTCAQNPDGGWRYWCFDVGSDNSNTGYAVLGLIYAEAPQYGFECIVSDTLKTNLSAWIDAIQNDVDGDTDDGGSDYTVGCDDVDNDGDGLVDEDPRDGLDNDGDGWTDEDPSGCWVNLLKTGNLLTEMALVDDPVGAGRVQDAIDYIERHWNDANQDPGWKGPPPHYQAMYCLMKGLAIYGIETITVDSAQVNWYDEMAEAIVRTQNADGSWPIDYWGDEILSTAWALLTLEVVIPDIVPPEVWSVETANPAGKKIPPAGSTTLPGPKGGMNEDGFYQLFAKDNKDPNPLIYVTDLNITKVFGPFTSGTVVKFTEAKGAVPSCKKIGSSVGQAGYVSWHITLPTDAVVVAVDQSGNWSWEIQYVPPLPK